jgi:hypothetical protein
MVFRVLLRIALDHQDPRARATCGSIKKTSRCTGSKPETKEKKVNQEEEGTYIRDLQTRVWNT